MSKDLLIENCRLIANGGYEIQKPSGENILCVVSEEGEVKHRNSDSLRLCESLATDVYGSDSGCRPINESFTHCPILEKCNPKPGAMTILRKRGWFSKKEIMGHIPGMRTSFEVGE